MLNAGYLKAAKLNGQTVNGLLKLFVQPVLARVAEQKGQVDRIKMAYLSNSKINMTEENIVLRGILLSRIRIMKGGSNPTHNIKFDTIYDELGVTAPSPGALRKKKSDIRNNTQRILDGLVDTGYIRKYEQYKEKQSIAGVTIFFNPEEEATIRTKEKDKKGKKVSRK